MPFADEEVQPQGVEDQVETADAAAGGRVHQPAPDDAGNDERDRHREDEQVAEEILAGQVLVEQDGHHQAQEQRAAHEDDREDERIADVDPEAGIGEQLDVVVQADPGVIRQQALPLAQRNAQRPGDKAVDKDAHRQDGRRHQGDRDESVVNFPLRHVRT